METGIQKLDEIEQRAAKATEGWRVVSVRNSAYGMMDHKLVDAAGLPVTNPPFATFLLADAQFAAHARQDVPSLVRALRLALERIERLETAAADYLYVGEGEDEWKASRAALLDAFGGEAAALAELSPAGSEGREPS